MKIRKGFVSNSSSSSFIVAVDKGAEKKKIPVEVNIKGNLNKFVRYTVTTIEELNEYFNDDYGYDEDELKKDERYQKAKKLIENGKVILFGSFSDQKYDEEGLEIALCNHGIGELSQETKEKTGLEIIYSEAGY